MNRAYLALGVLITYFGLLYLVAYFTGRKGSNDDFFRAGRKSPWFCSCLWYDRSQPLWGDLPFCARHSI